ASLTTGSTKQITQSYGNVFYSPPGYLVFLSDQVLMAQPFDAETGMLTDEPFQLGENPGFVPLTGQAAYSLSANGVLATGGGRVEARQYAWFDRQGSLLEIVTPPGNFFDIDLSPDGSRAVVQYDVGGDNSDIYVIDLVRKELTQFTFTPEVEDNPIWSSDGSMILFDRFAVSKPAVVYKKRSTGAGTEEPLPYDGRLSDWSNDGRYILFYAQGSGDITYADLNDGGKLTHYLATSATELYGHFSPNGKYVAYSSNESGIFEIYVQTFPEPGGKWRVSEGGGSQPEWRSDGKELFYIASDRTLMATQTSTNREFTYTAPKRLFRTQVDDFDAPNRYVVSNDGTRFLVNIPAGNSGGNPVTITVNWLEG
ncbi:MAG: PD40 domain-containing protein, partial [Proteobacteria bacterium]|nr:PD40 domain-containing protein [Pseudomonadota bacterium]